MDHRMDLFSLVSVTAAAAHNVVVGVVDDGCDDDGSGDANAPARPQILSETIQTDP